MADVWLATCSAFPDGEPEGHLLVEELARRGLRAAWAAWDDPGARRVDAPDGASGWSSRWWSRCARRARPRSSCSAALARRAVVTVEGILGVELPYARVDLMRLGDGRPACADTVADLPGAEAEET